jgi:hypothetical protein
MNRWILGGLAIIASSGCIATSLERHTLRQSESLSDLRTQEVMNNLALVANNPYALPSYSSIYAGTSDITDLASVTSTTVPAVRTLAGTTFGTQLLDIPFSRAIQQNWTLDPSIAPEKIRALRCACRWAVYGPAGAWSDFNVYLTAAPASDTGQTATPVPRFTVTTTAASVDSSTPGIEVRPAPGTDAEFVRQLPSDCITDPDRPGFYFGVADELQSLRSNWLRVGRKCSVPSCAAYSARCGDTSVWVVPNDVEELTKFTLVTQEIARVVVTSTYYPQPATQKIIVKNDTGKVTVYVYLKGFLVPADKGTAIQQRARMDNLASDAALRSQIANSKSSP